MTQETESVWTTLFIWGIVAFAIIGVFSVLGFAQEWNQHRLMYGEQAILENITVSDITISRSGVTTSFIDSNGRGYLSDGLFAFSRMDPIIIGHPYQIRYFCNPLDSNRRTVMEVIDMSPSPYECVTANGVCS